MRERNAPHLHNEDSNFSMQQQSISLSNCSRGYECEQTTGDSTMISDEITGGDEGQPAWSKCKNQPAEESWGLSPCL